MNIQTLLLTRGIPGSGKSTFAKQWVAQDPANRVRANRDNIRYELYGKYSGLSKDQEGKITQVEHSLIRKALKQNKNVIVDDMNLTQRFLKPYYVMSAESGVKLAHKDFPVALDEVLRRNANRDRKVPEDVIRKIYNNYLGPNGQFHHFDGDYASQIKSFVAPDTRKQVIGFDMDGTLSDTRSIQHFVKGKHRDFDAFHRSSLFTPPNSEVFKFAMDAHRAGFPLIITTARNEAYREVTQLWLDRLNFPYENIFMRADGDFRPDYVVKNEMLHEQIMPYYDILRMADDNPQAVNNWIDNGIEVTVVPGFGEESPTNTVLHIDNILARGGCIRCGKPLKSGAVIGPVCAKFS